MSVRTILTVSSMPLTYDCHFLSEGNGGSQGALLTFEKHAADMGHYVYSMQRFWRGKTRRCSDAWLQGKNFRFSANPPDLVVLMRRCDFKLGSKFRNKFKNAKIVCWVEDDNPDTSGLRGPAAPIQRAFFVSHTAALKSIRQTHTPPEKVSVVYNPFREPIEWYESRRLKAMTPFDIMVSGKPHHATLKTIAARLYEIDKRFQMHICASKWRTDANKGTIRNALYHGNLKREEFWAIFASCFVQLNPTESIETFGYSFAESNMLGIPVVTNHLPDSTAEEFLNHSSFNTILPDLRADAFVDAIVSLHRLVAANRFPTINWPYTRQMNGSHFTRNLIDLSASS